MSESTDSPIPRYIDPTDDQGRVLFTRGIEGSVVMLNLLRFRDTANYEGHPHLAPDHDISGRQAYDLYARHTQPFLEALGGSMTFFGEALPYLIGPPEEIWDVAMIVRHTSLNAFLGMATDPAYIAGIGHRQAALEDSRLLPILDRTASVS